MTRITGYILVKQTLGQLYKGNFRLAGCFLQCPEHFLVMKKQRANARKKKEKVDFWRLSPKWHTCWRIELLFLRSVAFEEIYVIYP